MIIVGISGGHDANWCVLEDGKLLGAFEKERFTRRRHDSGEVLSLIPKTLKFLNIDPENIDLIATSEPVHRGTDSGVKRLSGETYKKYDQWEHQIVECFGRILPCISVPHHLAHAAYARYTSDFDDTAVITWDGGGDFYTEDAYASTTISSWRGASLEWIKRIENSDLGSLWFTYSKAIFTDPNAAGKLMGLAALGSNRLVDAMSERFLVPVRENFEGAWTIKNCWADYYHPPFLNGTIGWKMPHAQDIAFAVQHLTNYAGLSIAEKAQHITMQKNLALSGGVALNGYLNTSILQSGIFDNVFVPPAVNDGGIAAGCALFAAHQVLKLPWSRETKYPLEFTGMEYGDQEVDIALEKTDLSVRKVELSQAVEVAAEALVRRQIVAWYEGRSEHGPRALGHRSILALPDKDEMRDKINNIKFREPYRPVAPVVLEDEANLFFEIDCPSPYMMHIVSGNERCAKAAPAALHIDKTARIQTTDGKTSLGQILERVRDLTGHGILLNTSFNVQSPIVETPSEAIEAYSKVPIDLLYLNGRLIERKK